MRQITTIYALYIKILLIDGSQVTITISEILLIDGFPGSIAAQMIATIDYSSAVTFKCCHYKSQQEQHLNVATYERSIVATSWVPTNSFFLCSSNISGDFCVSLLMSPYQWQLQSRNLIIWTLLKQILVVISLSENLKPLFSPRMKTFEDLHFKPQPHLLYLLCPWFWRKEIIQRRSLSTKYASIK